jgi:hypothetical protein
METNTVTKITPQAVPADYASLGVVTGYEPTPAKGLNMFIAGPSGEGKSTFLAGTPRTLILAFEKKGANGIPFNRAHRIPVPDKATLDRILDKLVADSKNPNRPYDRIGFDTIDQMVEMMNPEIATEYRNKTKWTGDDITEFGESGAGYAKLRTGCWYYFQELEKVGYAWTCVGHVTEKTITVNHQPRTVPRLVLFDSFSKVIFRNADVFATIYSMVEQEQTTIDFQGKKVPGPMKDIIRVYMDMTTIASEKNTAQGKLRSVPVMTSKIFLPEPLSGKHGWDSFEAEYTAAVNKVKAQINK